MAYDPMYTVISGILAGILRPALMAIHEKLSERRSSDEDFDISDYFHGDEKVLYYMMMILWAIWTIPMIGVVMGRVDYSIIGPVVHIIIATLTFMTYIWAYGFFIELKEFDIVRTSALTGVKRKSISEISRIDLKFSMFSSRANAVIEFSDHSKIKIYHWYTGFDYFMCELRDRFPAYPRHNPIDKNE